MKQIIYIFSLALFLLVSCSDDDKEITLNGEGTVINSCIANCNIIIKLDNGEMLQPLYYPEDCSFSEGQRVNITYVELDHIITGCRTGVPCEITEMEELSFPAYVDLYPSNYDSLSTDPFVLHEASIEDSYFFFKISYGGGCQEHNIDLARIHPNENDSIARFEIRHDAQNDLCETWITRDFKYDISTLKTEGIKNFRLTAQLYNDRIYSETFQLK